MNTIQDFGNKIGGAAKDRAAARGSRATPTGETTPSRPRQRKPLQFNFYIARGGTVYATKAGDRARRRLMEFASVAELHAFRATADAADILAAAWEAARDAGNVTEDKVRNAANKPRSGPDYRGGIDVTPDSFLATFRPYGVEFGNWQTDRAACLNQTHDALFDLGSVVGMAPEALTFGGRLALAFGARGHGKAAAHYEPGRRVINLTKTAGAGCLAHEWFHAYDHDAATLAGGSKGHASELRGHPVAEVLRAVPRALLVRSVEADKTRSGRYWSLPHEVMARVFEAWVRSQVENDYLANIVPAESFGPGSTVYPYPLPDEMPVIDAAFRSLFGR